MKVFKMRIFRSYNNFAIVIFRNCFLPSHGGHNLPLCWRVCLWLPLHPGVSIRQSNDEYNYVMRDGNLIYLLLAPFILVRQILSLLAPSENIRLVCETSGPSRIPLSYHSSIWMIIPPVCKSVSSLCRTVGHRYLLFPQFLCWIFFYQHLLSKLQIMQSEDCVGFRVSCG